MQVVNSIYSFDEKVLIYAEYVELLEEILDKVKKYYEIKAKNKWSIFAAISIMGVVGSLLVALFFYKHQQYVYLIFSILGIAICVGISFICVQRIKILENRFQQVQAFLNSEITQITLRDNETRSLRLIERHGFDNIIEIEAHKDGYFVHFDELVYNKPFLVDMQYIENDTDTLNLSVYDNYYQSVEQRIKQFKNSKTLQELDKLMQVK